MTRLISLSLILILFVSCSKPVVKKTIYNSEAVELNNKAVRLMEMAKDDSALILLDKSIALDNSYYLAHSNKVGIYIRKKEYDKALAESELVIKIRPDLAVAWTQSGMLHEKLGEINTAKKYYEKSIELFDERIKNPDKSEQIKVNKINRAFAFILLDQEEKGKEELRKVKAEYPHDIMIDELLKVSKKEFMDEMFENQQ